MKILRTITRLNTGGPAIQAIDLTAELAKLGHSTLLISGLCPKHEDDMWSYYLDKTRGLSVSLAKYRYLPSLKREMNLRNDYLTLKRLIHIIRREKPDIIHSHMSKAGLLTRVAALWVRIRYGYKFKLIYTFHGHVFHSYFGKWKSRLFVWLEWVLARWTDTIVAISPSQKKELVNHYKIASADKVRVIPLGFNLVSRLLMIAPLWWENTEKATLRVGIIGRLTAVKDHELFFDFIEELMRFFLVKVFIFGDGERKSKLVQKVAWRGLSSVINFEGWVDYGRVLCDIYERLDLVVLTSKNEGTPVTLIEAMAAGKLVVSTKVGGIEDLVGKDAERGIYLYRSDIGGTARFVHDTLNSGRYKGIVKRAREFARKNYRLDRLVEDIVKLYEA